MNEEELEYLNEMIKNRYRTEDIIQYFMKHGKGRVISEWEVEMRKFLDGKNLSEDEILELFREKLSSLSLQEMEEMLKSGLSKSEIIKIILKTGKTDDMLEKEMRLKMATFVNDENTSIEEKVMLVKDQLNIEAKCLMEELLKQGYSKEEVLDLFTRCANDLESVHQDPLFKKTVRFSDEPPDAYLYEARNVWSMIDIAEVKLNVPMMTNNSKCATFAAFFSKVVRLTTGRGLTHREILDLIRFRLGGDYGQEFDDLR